MKWLIPLMLLATVACSSNSKLSHDAKNVKVFGSKPDSDCEVVGKVIGINEEGSVELARNHARNMVADQDGNAIVFDEEVANGSVFKVYSTGYKCP
ncbi:MAG: hypothetical protein ACOYL6_11080 [Bacteriovoracaceae bacterium]